MREVKREVELHAKCIFGQFWMDSDGEQCTCGQCTQCLDAPAAAAADDVIEVGAGGAAAVSPGGRAGAGAGVKARKVVDHSNQTRDVSVIRAWDAHVFGIGDGYTAEERAVAMTYLPEFPKTARQVICGTCGVLLKSHKGTVQSHQTSAACIAAKDRRAAACAAAASAGRLPPQGAEGGRDWRGLADGCRVREARGRVCW